MNDLERMSVADEREGRPHGTPLSGVPLTQVCLRPGPARSRVPPERLGIPRRGNVGGLGQGAERE